MDKIIKNIEDSYGIRIQSGIRLKNVYRINTEDGCYCFKIIKYKRPHFNFIIAAMEHLRKNSFEELIPIIPTISNDMYISLNEGNGYLLPWIKARECNYDNPYDLQEASKVLARLHKHSKGFLIKENMAPRIGWFRWIDTYETRRGEILDFKKRIHQKASNSEFDKLYLSLMEKELNIADNSIENLKRSAYKEIMLKEVFNGGFCHHDFAHHNLLVTHEGDFKVIDFDYCILDSCLHDVSSLLLRAMKNGRWELDKTALILNSYNEENIITQEQIPVMSAFMEFPQDYWQLGIQYYWEQQNYGEDFFINRLIKVKEDIEDKREFIESFRGYKLYGGKE